MTYPSNPSRPRPLLIKSAIKAGGFRNHAAKRLVVKTAVKAGTRLDGAEPPEGMMNHAAKRLVVKTAIKAGTRVEGWRKT